jgi:hypothetical protein
MAKELSYEALLPALNGLKVRCMILRMWRMSTLPASDVDGKGGIVIRSILDGGLA